MFACAVIPVTAQHSYDVVMPGQHKVTVTDEHGNTTTQIVTDTVSDNIYYKDGYYTFKGHNLSEEEFAQKMKAECQPAYQKFQQSIHLKRGSVVMMGVGGAALLVGGGFFAWGGATADYISVNYYQKQLAWNWQMISGLCLMLGGGATLLGGVVVYLQKAPDCKREAAQIYNTKCAGKGTALSLNAGITNDGFGLIMSF